MMRNRARAYDIAGQWTGPGRDRFEDTEPFRHRRERKRKAIIPACSADGE
jgi:hypothetical protein